MLRRSYFATPRLSTYHSSSSTAKTFCSPFQTTSHRFCSTSSSSILSFKHQPESKSFLVNINNRKSNNSALSSYSISVPYVFLADHSLTLVEPSTFQRSIPINFERDQVDANKNKFFDENSGSSSSFIDDKLKLAFFKRNETEWLAVPVESFFQLIAAREGQMKGSPKVAGDLFDALMDAFEANSSSSAVAKTEDVNDTKNDILDELINTSSSSEATQKKNARGNKEKEIPEQIKKLIESHHNLESIRSALGLTSGHVRLAVSNWLQHREKTQSIHETLEEVDAIQNEQEKAQSERALKLSMNSFEFGNPAMMAKSDTIKLWKRKDILEALSSSDDSSATSTSFSSSSPSPKVSGIFPEEMHEFVQKNKKNISSSSSLYESQVQSLLSSPSAKVHRKNIISRVAHSIEKFGFCVIEDPVLTLGLPQPLSLNTAEEPTGMPSSGMIADLLNNRDDPERALQVVHRRNSVDFILKFLFGVLMNSHYGVTPVWGNFVDPNAPKNNKNNNHRQNCSSSSSSATKKNQTDHDQQQQQQQQSEIDHLDTAYLTCGIDLHTDQTYSIQSPKLQGFGLIHNDPTTSKGGKNVLADGFAIAKHMQEHYPKEFATLLSNSCPAYYCKDGRLLGGYRSVFDFSHNSFGSGGGGKSISQISFNAYDRAPAVVFDLAATTNKKSKNSNETMMMRKMNHFYEAYSLFGDLCHDRIVSNKKNQDDDHFSFELQPQIGQLLIFDNHRCLHARTGFTGPRIMCGSYVGVDDYFSALNHYQL